MNDNINQMYSYQISERNREIIAIEEKMISLEKQIEVLDITKKLRRFEIDVLKEQRKQYEEKYL